MLFPLPGIGSSRYDMTWNFLVASHGFFCYCRESPACESDSVQASPVKNKHPEDDPVEAEGHEVKRLKFDKEGEARETSNQTASSEVSSVMVEETGTSTSQDKEKDPSCVRQHCAEDEEEGI